MSKNHASIEVQEITSAEVGRIEDEAGALVASPESGAIVSFADSLFDDGQEARVDRSGDKAVPFIVLLQKGSPQVEDGNPAQIPNARAGMALNNITQDLYDCPILSGKGAPKGLNFLSCGYTKLFVEWIPRVNGAKGGFVAQHLPESKAVKNCRLIEIATESGKKKVFRTPEGNDMVETNYHYVTVLNADGSISQGVIGMSGSQLTPSRRFNLLVDNAQIGGKPTKEFAIVYTLRSTLVNKTPSWWMWDVSSAGSIADYNAIPMPTRMLAFQKAKKYFDDVRAGIVKITAPPVEESSSLPDKGDDEDVPF